MADDPDEKAWEQAWLTGKPPGKMEPSVPADPTVFPISGNILLRICCTSCDGVLEITPAELAKVERIVKFGVPPFTIYRCPKCNAEFSLGMQTEFKGDRVKVIGQMFHQLLVGNYCAGFRLELVRKGNS